MSITCDVYHGDCEINNIGDKPGIIISKSRLFCTFPRNIDGCSNNKLSDYSKLCYYDSDHWLSNIGLE